MGDKDKQEDKGKKPAEYGQYPVVLIVGVVIPLTVSTLVLVPTVRGFLLVPRRGRGYAVNTMRTSS